MAKVQIVLDERYKTQQGLYAIKLSLSHLSKTTYITTEFKIAKEDWNAEAQQIKAKCKRYNSVTTNIGLNDSKKEIEEFLIQLNSEKSLASYTLSELINMFEDSRKVSKMDDIEVLFNMYIAEKKSKNPDSGTAGLYQNTLRLLQKYCENRKTKISAVTYSFLKGFEEFLRTKEDNQINGIAMNMRNIRTVYNFAISLKIVEYNKYPFRSYQITHQKTAHRNISIEDFVHLFRYKGTDAENKALNLFKLSFYLRGMNFKDMLKVRNADIYNNYILYKRAKTDKEIRVKIEPEAKAIIKMYQGKEYMLNFLEVKSLTAKTNRITPLHKDITRNVNRRLKSIMDAEKINIPISTYYARHTWATLAREINIAYDIIKAALGHEMHDVTSVYVKTDDKIVDAANRQLIDYINQCILKMPIREQNVHKLIKKSIKKTRRRSQNN